MSERKKERKKQIMKAATGLESSVKEEKDWSRVPDRKTRAGKNGGNENQLGRRRPFHGPKKRGREKGEPEILSDKRGQRIRSQKEGCRCRNILQVGGADLTGDWHKGKTVLFLPGKVGHKEALNTIEEKDRIV